MKKIVTKYEFDTPELKAAWNQLMGENREGMAIGLGSILQQLGIESDPVIYLKEDVVLIKKINTDKGMVFVYEDESQEKIVSKPYKLVADNEAYMVFENKALVVWFRRNGGVDVSSTKAFDSVDMAVNGMKHIDDPKVVEERIAKIDADQAEQLEKMKAEAELKVVE